MCTCTLQTAERYNIEELKTNRFTDIKKIIKNPDIMHVNNEHEGAFPKSRNVFFLAVALFLQDIFTNSWK
jgi:hypothetical protein